MTYSDDIRQFHIGYERIKQPMAEVSQTQAIPAASAAKPMVESSTRKDDEASAPVDVTSNSITKFPYKSKAEPKPVVFKIDA